MATSRGKGPGKQTAVATSAKKRPIEQYEHPDKKRPNNPQVGLVTPESDPDTGASRKTYAYDPHLDPQLVWAGKAEHLSFEVPTVSLHVHERVDPKTVMEAVKRTNGSAGPAQMSLFASEAKAPLREALDFYKHPHAWSNRLIAGDSLLVMNSLLEKEGMAGKVQMVYIDPPYGIEYASNFQPFTNNRTVRERDSDVATEPETIKAFRDTWALGIHSYLAYLRDRLLVSRELLHGSGSVFVQIGDENVHLVRALLDEVFGPANFMALIAFRKKMMPLSKKAGCESMSDYIVWYVRSKAEAESKVRQLFLEQRIQGDSSWAFVQFPNGERRALTPPEVDDHSLLSDGARVYSTISMKPREYRQNQDFNFALDGRTHPPPGGKLDATPDGVHCWSTTREGMERLRNHKRLQPEGNTLRYILFHDDYPVVRLTAAWPDTAPAKGMRYVVETSSLVVQRCMLMATGPGDLVFDPTCGSGTTAFVAEQWGRRWVTCDTSRVAITLAKQRLMTAAYRYYQLAHPAEGVTSGFEYEKVQHLTLGNLANDEPAGTETLYDQPKVDNSKVRVTSPFTVEAVPAPTVRPVIDTAEPLPADAWVAREGETLRQAEWRAELLKTGVRGKNNQMLTFARVEPLSGTRWLHADAEVRPNDRGADHVHEVSDGARRGVVSFGPEHAPLEQKQVEMAWEEARKLSPRPSLLLFAAFQFDPEAAKDIDELTLEKTGMTFLKVQMNPDLLTDDLKKKRASNESFWLMGQPDVELRQIAKGEQKGKCQVEVHGFDYYNTKTGAIESGDSARIALWMLDTDYDGRSLFPRQVFFPLADEAGGWARLARNLKAEIDEEKIEAYRGTVSLPFEPGRRIAVKIVDDRGIESLKVIEVK